jgi:hypothetical protein
MFYRPGPGGAVWRHVEGQPAEVVMDWCPEVVRIMDVWGSRRSAMVKAFGQTERVGWSEVLSGSMWRRFDLDVTMAEADILTDVIALEMVRSEAKP